MSAYSTKSVLFNGTTQYGTAGDVLGFEYNQPFSISFWFKATDAEAYPVSKLLGPTTYRGWGVALSTGKLGFSLVNDNGGGVMSQIITDATFNGGNWHHVVCTYTAATPGDAADMDIFVDGEDVPTSVLLNTLGSNTMVSAAPLNVAGRTDGSVLLDGSVDEVAVYDKALSAAEVSWIYNAGNTRDLEGAGSPSGLQSWWRMGEDAVGAVVPDQLGATGYAPLTTSIYIASDLPDRTEGGVFPDPLTIPPTGQAFTMGCWFRRSSSNTSTVLVSKCRGPGSGRTWQFRWYDHDTARVAWSDNNYDLQFRTVAVPSSFDGVWHLALMTYDGVNTANSKVYIDGVAYSAGGGGSWSGQAGGAANDGSFVVGGLWGGTNVEKNWYQGNVCHSFLYDKVLSQAEVTAIYGGGVPQDLSSVGPTANLKHWCAMGDGDALGSGNLIDLSSAGLDGTYVNGESGDFQNDVPMGGNPLTLVNSPTIQDEAPPGTQYDSEYVAAVEEDRLFEFSGFASGHDYDSDYWAGVPVYVEYYYMRGIDQTCPAIQQPAYVYWTAQDAPDWLATLLTPGDLPCGTDPSTDVVDINIAGRWQRE